MKLKSYIITFLLALLFPTHLFIACSPTPRVIEGEKPEVSEQIRKTDLEHQLSSIFKRDEFKHTIPSILVVSADYRDTIFSLQSDLLVRPASNQKLVTSVSALTHLGKNYNFRTIVYYTGDINDGVLNGDLVVKGFGDPLLSLADLDTIVEAIGLFGIREIAGNIIVDESFFDDVFWPRGWMWDDEPQPFAPFISALAVNSNVVTFTIERSSFSPESLLVNVTPRTSYIQYELRLHSGTDTTLNDMYVIPERMSGQHRYLIKGDPQKVRLPRRYTVTVRDPAIFTGMLLWDKLQCANIPVSGKVTRGVKDNGAFPIIQINTPIDSVLHAMNKNSDNLAAEMVWKTISAELYGPPGTGDGGSTAAHHALQNLSIDSGLFNLVDGSGVSFYNLITTRGIAELLLKMYDDQDLFPPFYESLAIMGVDGTLLRRGMHSRTRGRVRAKTGTLTGVSSLAGYIETLNGETLVIAMFFQNFTLPAGRYRQIQDEICEILIRFNREASVLTTPMTPDWY